MIRWHPNYRLVKWLLAVGLLAAVLVLTACECGTTPPTTTTTPTTEYPPIPQQELLIEYALELINEDRIANGLDTVTLGSNSAAQYHAEEMLAEDYSAHWGIDGMKPYMRYTLAGGFNYDAENVFITRTIWLDGKDPSYQIDPIEVLEDAEESLMNSSVHRRNILNKWHKKVNLGIAFDHERLTLVQQFEGDYITFNESPVFSGSSLTFSGKTITGSTFDQIQIWYDPLPHSLTLGQLGRTSAYWYGTPAAFIRPPPSPGSDYPTSETFFSWAIDVDPYSIPADTPPPTYNPSGIPTVSPPLVGAATVKWIDAKHWDVSGTAFNIDVDLNEIISKYGKGVYTVVIWAKIGNEPAVISNYSIFIE